MNDVFPNRFARLGWEDVVSPDIGIMCWAFLFVLSFHDSIKAIDSAAKIPTNSHTKGKMTLLSAMGYASFIPNCSFLLSCFLMFLGRMPFSKALEYNG